MRRSRLWGKVAGWTLPALVLGFGLFPPHVIPSLAPAFALGALLLALALAGEGRLPSPPPSLVASLSAAGLILFLSSFTAFHPLRSARIAVMWLIGSVVFLAARLSAGPGARRLVSGLILLGALLAAVGLWQSLVLFPEADLSEVQVPLLGGGEREAEAARVRIQSGRAVGTLGLPALLASILILGLPLAAGRALAGSGWWRAAWLIALILQGAALAATRSMGGLGALVAAAALCGILWTGSRPLMSLAAVAGLSLLVLPVLLPRLEHAGPGSAVQSVTLRLANWKSAASMIVTHPALGVGPGNFGVALPGHLTPGGNETQHAHNIYLEMVADTGAASALLILLGLAWILLAVRDLSLPNRETDGKPDWQSRALALAVLAWLLQGFVDFGAYVGGTLIPFMAAAGLLAREAALARAEPDRVLGRAPAGPLTRAVLITLVLVAVAFTVPDARSRTHLEEAVEHVRAGRSAGALAEAGKAVSWNPLDPEARVFLAQAILAQVEAGGITRGEQTEWLARARHEAEMAVSFDPVTANRRAVLARVRAASGDVAGAYAAMAMAARLNPAGKQYQQQQDLLGEILEGRSAPAGGRTPP